MSFEMPTGAPADVAELEFLSALLQTSPELKTYITGKDIHCYLISRHGLKREIREIEDCILKELAGCIVQEDIVKAEAEQPLGLKEGGESENAKESSANATAQDTETAENENPAVEKQGKSKILQHQAVENKLEWEEAVDVEPRNESMEEPREEPNMDLVQLLALLMIPELVREIDAEQQVLFRVFFQILADGSGIAPETLLTKEVLETILTTYGECWPDFVLEEMLSACRPHGSSELPIFDKETMARALTVDIIEYPLNQETMTTTHQQDAATPKGVSLSRMFTAPNIDYTADSFRSYLWAGLTWMTLVVTFIAYLFKGISGVDIKMKTLECDPGNVTLSDDNSNPDVGCTVANGIVVWIQIFLVLVVLGLPFIYLTSLGNSVYALRRKCMGYFTSLVGIVAVMFFTIFAYGFEVETKLFDTTKEEGKGIQYVVSVFLGCLLLSTQVFHLLGLVMPSHLQHKSCMKPLRSGVIKMERWIKLAAARKAQNVLSNAIFCHSSKPSTTAEETPSMHYSQRATTFLESSLENTEAPKALLRYQEQADTTVQIGGISWVWRRMFNNKIYKEDGVWISPRLGASNLIQWFVVLLIPVFYYNGAKWIESSLEHLTEDDQIAVRTGVAVGAVAAFLFSMYTSLVYIPSSVLTIFRFRSGSIPSLRDRGFLKYRSAQDRTTSLFGSMFWGIIITAIIAWCVIGGLTFLIFWTAIRPIIIAILANLVGIASTVALKLIVLLFLRSQWYAAFYRKKPAQANIMMTVLECWNLGISSGFILMRAVKVLFISVLYLGRVDTPLLAPGVGRLVCMELDDFPISFRKELLGHEAHRHPFIERLGLLYMLKLRLGARFGSRAGAGWRILFVVVLMPWMRRYRRSTTRSREEKEGQSSLFRSSSFSFQNISHAAVVMRKQELERENVTLRRENERLQKMLLSRELKNGLWSTRFYGKQKGEIDGGRSARFRERHDGGIIIVEA